MPPGRQWCLHAYETAFQRLLPLRVAPRPSPSDKFSLLTLDFSAHPRLLLTLDFSAHPRLLCSPSTSLLTLDFSAHPRLLRFSAHPRPLQLRRLTLRHMGPLERPPPARRGLGKFSYPRRHLRNLRTCRTSNCAWRRMSDVGPQVPHFYLALRESYF